MLLYKLIDKVPFFDELTKDEKAALVEADSYFSTYEPSTVIIREGDEDTTLFILLDGNVLVTKNNTPLTKLHPGAVFGEMSFFTKKPRSTDIISMDKVTVFQLNSEMFPQLSVELQHKLQSRFIDILARRLDEMNGAIAKLFR